MPVHVKIGPVDLMSPQDGAYADRGVNPMDIEWSQEFPVEEKKIVRHKPHSQCTEKYALWVCRMSFTTNDWDKKEQLRQLHAGPYKVLTAFQECDCWITSKSAKQVEGFDDDVFDWSITFKEVNPGGLVEAAGEDVTNEDLAGPDD